MLNLYENGYATSDKDCDVISRLIKEHFELIEEAKLLQDEVDKYKHEYFSMCDLIENPQPYIFEELKVNMLVFVTSIGDIVRIIEIYEKEIVCEMIGWEIPTVVYYKESRFFPLTKALEVKENDGTYEEAQGRTDDE